MFTVYCIVCAVVLPQQCRLFVVYKLARFLKFLSFKGVTQHVKISKAFFI